MVPQNGISLAILLFVACLPLPLLASKKLSPKPQQVSLDPATTAYTPPSQIHWQHDPIGADTAVLAGDPSKPGMYIVLVKWAPHHMSHPHWHPNDRFITVLSGTWWVGTGTKFDPQRTVPMPAGSFVTDFAKHVHYDGAKDQEVTLEIVGEGPATASPAEQKP
ncbi:MAG TPA: cupin domain-containing protein [Candidatus Acidoferrales bacterium]|nr:cupin domain-containing protein [Candidatus Acidoferrales bacterium]